MESENSLSICILGLGRVGKQLYSVFQKKNLSIQAIYNRSKVGSVVSPTRLIHDIDEIPTDASIYILSVSDDAIEHVAKRLPKPIQKKKIVAHTSGIHALDIFPEEIKHPGVFYPLNTFSDQQDIDWNQTPFYISGDKKTSNQLRSIAQHISERVYTISDEQKRVLHLAAVIANNFPNHLFAQADELLEENGLEFKHLLPLVQTMVRNLEEKSAGSSQTGPAIRGDQKTINKHLRLLQNKPKLQEIYRTLSGSINKDLNV